MIKRTGDKVKLKLVDHGRRKNSESRVIRTYINYGRFSYICFLLCVYFNVCLKK
jgi:hypothetical protein